LHFKPCVVEALVEQRSDLSKRPLRVSERLFDARKLVWRGFALRWAGRGRSGERSPQLDDHRSLSRELIARIKAVLRRNRVPSAGAGEKHKPTRYRFDRWTFNVDSRELERDDGVAVPLSTGEHDLLLALVERPKRTLSRDQLLDLARGRSAQALDRSIDTQVSRLRKKIERNSGDPKLIKTVWGDGYIFTPAVSRE